jgi:superkiller protein 3
MAPSSGLKAALKAAKAAIDVREFPDAIQHAEEALQADPKNYLALVFVGHSYDKLKQPEKAEKPYLQATEVRPEDDQAWQGLRALYESGKRVSELIHVSDKLAEIYMEKDDQHKCQGAIDRVVLFAKEHGTREQYVEALKLQLPTKPFYAFLGGRLPSAPHTYQRLAEITEEQEEKRINTEIGEQRMRLGAKKADVIVSVKRAVYEASPLEDYYQGIIDWSNEDEQRRDAEEKKLKRVYEHMLVAKQEDKEALRSAVADMSHGMVVIKHPFEMAWDIELEWKDVESLAEMDILTIRDYIGFFPAKGLTKVLSGYLASDINPFPKPELEENSLDDSDDEGGGVTLETEDDRILDMNDGVLESPNSMLAHRIMSDYLLHLEEEETAVEIVRKGLKICADERKKTGLKLQKTMDSLNTILATALIKYQSPRHHPEAKKIFEQILKRRETFTPALLGVGLILEEEEDFVGALDYLARALQRDSQNLVISSEAAWCNAVVGNWQKGLQDLASCLEKIDQARAEDKSKKLTELRAQVLYRIGRCQWELDPSRASRKDRKRGPYASFLQAVKTDSNYAPAYTSLGIFYEEYAKDKARARQCFQRAFDLSPSEVVAAEKLARSFADLGDWEVVEVIAKRVVESGKAKIPTPIPGQPPKKGISWPYSALGVAQLNRHDYQKAIVSFLQALRIDPNDYHSYVGLGESYHNSGRYNSALRTFTLAENPGSLTLTKGEGEGSEWFTKYMLANVSRELGDHDDAIEAYKKVLEERPDEFGVEIALLQTYLEKASRCLETGFFGRAADSAAKSFEVAKSIVKLKPDAFNLWKAVGDACSVFTQAQERIGDFPATKALMLVCSSKFEEDLDKVAPKAEDGVGKALTAEIFLRLADAADENEEDPVNDDDFLFAAINTAIAAHKRALHCVAGDKHAHAVAWYNLGWAQQQAYFVWSRRQRQFYMSSRYRNTDAKRYLRAAVKSFKRSIELEPTSSVESWNGLGVATSLLNAKVSQHAFVRSLIKDEQRNPKAWTGLGALALLKNDVELAHQAFAKGQSADPDFAAAWTGEGEVAVLLGDRKEGWAHFEHAVGISDSDLAIAREEYAKTAFDGLALGKLQHKNTEIVQPVLLALQQLKSLKGPEPALEHLNALFRERAGDHLAAVESLEKICEALEAQYEEKEDEESLIRFVQAKADLARNLLATKDYVRAAEEAETALNLTEDDQDTESSDDTGLLRSKIRLSARLTVGLASFYLDDMDAALSSFKLALKETRSAPDVICSLAQVLWAKGGKRERTVAKEQLLETFKASEKNDEAPEGSIATVLMLGAMSVLEQPPNVELARTTRKELQKIQVRNELSRKTQDGIRNIIAAIDQVLFQGNHAAQRQDAQKDVMLFPTSPGSWTRFSKLLTQEQTEKEDAQAATDMALLLAERKVPPRGDVNGKELAEALARTGRLADVQTALMMWPGSVEAWKALGGCIERMSTPSGEPGLPTRTRG